MVNPTWFFSTLAQASAAIAGLVVAFSAVRYQVERRQREKRTDELRKELIDLREKYADVINVMMNSIGPNLPKPEGWSETWESIKEPLEHETKELEEAIDKSEHLKQPIKMRLYVHLFRIHKLLMEIEESSQPDHHYLLSSEQFIKMGESTKSLAELFGPPHNLVEKLYSEIDGNSEETTGDPRFSNAFDTRDIEGAAVEEVREWTMTYKPETAETLVILEKPEENIGRSLASWGNILMELREDFQTVDAMTGFTIIDYHTSNVSTIISVSGVLLLVGVFLPVLFLIVSPQSWITISGWPLFFLQVILLILAGIVTGYLLYLIRKSMTF